MTWPLTIALTRVDFTDVRPSGQSDETRAGCLHSHRQPRRSSSVRSPARKRRGPGGRASRLDRFRGRNRRGWSTPWTTASTSSTQNSGQMTTLPQLNRAGTSSPSTGKERTSVSLFSAVVPVQFRILSHPRPPPPGGHSDPCRFEGRGHGRSTRPGIVIRSRLTCRSRVRRVRPWRRRSADQPVPDHVLPPKRTNLTSSIPSRISRRQPDSVVTRQVDLGDVTGHHHLRVEAEPGEEHLHLFGVVFLCTSSRITKASFRVRPRMKVSGRPRSRLGRSR